VHHEAQHQELLLTDIKALFALNPLRPAYCTDSQGTPTPVSREERRAAPSEVWIVVPGGVQEIGYAGDGFCFDNERPRHAVVTSDARISARSVTNREFMEFIEDGGYRRVELWLSDAWKAVNERGWMAPLYWEKEDDAWWHYTLRGMAPVDPEEPVCHVSFYEADAYARWRGARLPNEAEWEVATAGAPVRGNFLESGALHPAPQRAVHRFGDVWTWTQSPYVPYPGNRPLAGSLGEYNGKFMVNQLVLRGGSCVSPAWHVRPTYRNFFYGPDRWQFTGLHLARDDD
jgi:ergothioneine biosynthesis protein EgtB